MATAAMFAAEARFTATVLVDKSAACDKGDVVMPLDRVSTHSDPAGRVAVAAVKVTAALAVPELEPATVKVVSPHPGDLESPPGEAVMKVGRVSTMESATSNGAFEVHLYEIADAV